MRGKSLNAGQGGSMPATGITGWRRWRGLVVTTRAAFFRARLGSSGWVAASCSMLWIWVFRAGAGLVLVVCGRWTRRRRLGCSAEDVLYVAQVLARGLCGRARRSF